MGLQHASHEQSARVSVVRAAGQSACQRPRGGFHIPGPETDLTDKRPVRTKQLAFSDDASNRHGVSYCGTDATTRAAGALGPYAKSVIF